MCRYNLQKMSQEGHERFDCPQCGKKWESVVNTEKKSCCGNIIVKFMSIEVNLANKSLVCNERVRN